MKKKNLFGTIASIGTGAVMATGYALFNYIQHRDSKALKGNPPKFPADNPVVIGQKKFAVLPHEKYTIESYDHLKLSGFLTRNRVNKGTVIIVHGFGVDHHSLDKIGYLFNRIGYNVLQPDNRAAGDSEGKYLTYGFDEKRDVLSWVDFVKKDSALNKNIVLYGASMGAATVLQFLQLKVPSEVKGVIADSSYSNTTDESNYVTKKQLKIPAKPLVGLVSMWSKIVCGFSYKEASPIDCVGGKHVPILFIRGLADKTVPPEMSQDLFDAATQPKYLATFPKGAHIRSLESDPKRYNQVINEFLDKLKEN